MQKRLNSNKPTYSFEIKRMKTAWEEDQEEQRAISKPSSDDVKLCESHLDGKTVIISGDSKTKNIDVSSGIVVLKASGDNSQVNVNVKANEGRGSDASVNICVFASGNRVTVNLNIAKNAVVGALYLKARGSQPTFHGNIDGQLKQVIVDATGDSAEKQLAVELLGYGEYPFTH